MLTIQEICDECQPLAYRFGRDLFLKDAFVRVSTEYSKETMECVISGKVRDTIWQEAWVALDMEDRITDYNCGCSNSKSFKGMCRHCAALTLKYRQLSLKPGWNKQANGEDAEGTSEQNVKTGVLLKNLLNRFDSTEIVAVTAGGSVHLYPKVESDGGKYHLALSIGNDRKKYTVNNIYHFLYMTETRAFERYGRHLSFTHDRSAFSENALSLIEQRAAPPDGGSFCTR